MNGHVLNELPISVDCFIGLCNSRGTVMHFLSHVHADHIVGLTRDFKYKIYCSEITAKLIRHKLDITSDIIVELTELDCHVLYHGDFSVSVTLIPANHCPGSTMFLFETPSHRILYTGDFRFSKCLSNMGLKMWGIQEITTLYLDNTYCEPTCEFPQREISVDKIIKICEKHAQHKIYIGINWIGHENLLLSVAKKLNENIIVSEKQFKVFELLRLENVFTTDKTLGRIHAVPSHSLSIKFISEIRKTTPNVIGILPTARLCNGTSNHQDKSAVFTVPYSNHSSYRELFEFVREVKPQKIYPIVIGKKSDYSIGNKLRSDMSQFNMLLSKNKQSSHETLSTKRIKLSPIENLQMNSIPSKRRRKFVKFKKSKKPTGVVFEDD